MPVNTTLGVSLPWLWWGTDTDVIVIFLSIILEPAESGDQWPVAAPPQLSHTFKVSFIPNLVMN